MSGNYETGIKMVAPIFFGTTNSIQDIPYKNMIIALLARLKRQNKIQWRMPHSNQNETKLNAMVDAFISGGGISPNDATHILSSKI